MMNRLNAKGNVYIRYQKKLIEELYNSDEREEYAGVKLYYFRKKYNSLIRRGM